MDLVELLMAEHATLRLHFKFFKELPEDSIFEIDSFLIKCHSKVEDDIVFRMLEDKLLRTSSSNERLERIFKKIREDHMLLASFSDQIRSWTVEGENQLLKERLALYADTVLSHNSAEEVQIFP